MAIMFDDCCAGCHGAMAPAAAHAAEATKAAVAQLEALGRKVSEAKSELLASSPELAAMVARHTGGRALPNADSVKNLGVDYCLGGQAFVALETRHSKAAAQLQRLHAIRPQETSAAARLANTGLRPATRYGLSAAGWPSS